MSSNSCEICSAIINSRETNHEIWNTKLHETNNFIILPTIGPLIDGQVIIASKNHSINLLSMNNEEISDFNLLVKYTEAKIGKNVLFAEHGASDFDLGGSCIDHTHIHVFPGMENYYSILDDALPISDLNLNIGNFEMKDQIDFPYILTFNLKNGFRLYQAYNAHSQMIRKAICAKENISNWNWRNNYQIESIYKTIRIWKK